jgi:hypothetical protein
MENQIKLHTACRSNDEKNLKAYQPSGQNLANEAKVYVIKKH